MATFIIVPPMRLQEWVAEARGYFRDEGLDYGFRPGRDQVASIKTAEELPPAAGHGRLWGEAYSVSPSGIYVPPGERIVFEPYTQAMFDATRRWVEDWQIFPEGQGGGADYAASVLRVE